MTNTFLKSLAASAVFCAAFAVFAVQPASAEAIKYALTPNQLPKNTTLNVAATKQVFSTQDVTIANPALRKARSVTFTGVATSKTKAVAVGQLCAWVQYTDNKTASRCVRTPTYISKSRKLSIVLPLNVSKTIKYMHAEVQALGKKQTTFTIGNLSAVLSVPAAALKVPYVPAENPVVNSNTNTVGDFTTNNTANSNSSQKDKTITDTTRANASALMLQNNTVLIAGGSVNGTNVDTVDIFDLQNRSLTTLGANGHYGTVAAATLNNGLAYIAGGYTGPTVTTPNVWLSVYSPVSKTLSVMPRLQFAHAPVGIVVLSDELVLFLEGASDCDSDGHITQYPAELYHVLNNTMTPTNIMGGSVGTKLKNNLVLVRGFKGCAGNSVTGGFTTLYSSDAKMYDASSNSINDTSNSYSYPNAGRQGPKPRAGIVLKNGNVFFADYGSTTGYTVFQTFNPTAGGTFASDAQVLNQDPGAPLYENANGTITLFNSQTGTFNTYNPSTKVLTPLSAPETSAIATIPNGTSLFAVVKN